MLNRRDTLRLLPAVTALGTGCGKTATTGTPRVLRLAVTPHLSMSPVYLAKEKGFFQEEGLDVALERHANSREILPLLSAGKLDAAYFSFSAALVNLAVRGAKVRIVAAREQFSQGCGDQGALFLRKARFGKGAEDPAAWKGARVAMTGRSTFHEYVLERVVHHLGLPADALVTKIMRNEEALAAAAAGQLDILTGAARPGQARSEVSSQFERTDIAERVLPNFQFSYVVFGPSMVNGDLDTGRRLLRAQFKATASYLAGETPAFVAEYAKELGLNYEALRGECRKGTSADGAIQEKDLQALLDWSFEKKDLERRVLTSELVDRRFLAAMSA